MVNSWKFGEEIDIWFFITSLSAGGAERNLVHTANYLSEQDINVSVYTIFDENPLQDELSNDVEFNPIGISAKMSGQNEMQVAGAQYIYSYPKAVFQFLIEVWRNQPDIIQSYLFYDNILSRSAKLVSSDTIIINGIRCVPENRDHLRTFVDKITLPLSDHIISNSKAGRRMAVEMGAQPSNVSVIDNAVNVDKFVSAEEIDIRSELNIHSDKKIVGNVSRLIRRKGHYELLKAWSELQSQHSNIELVLIGDGPEYCGLKDKAKDLNIGKSVHFLQYREDVDRLLHTLDYFVFPSHFEGLPGALIEAMIAGLPIVATNVSGNDELITHRETGLLAPPHNIKELERKLQILLETDELAQYLANNAQQEARERFSIRKTGRLHIGLYEKLIK